MYVRTWPLSRWAYVGPLHRTENVTSNPTHISHTATCSFKIRYVSWTLQLVRRIILYANPLLLWLLSETCEEVQEWREILVKVCEVVGFLSASILIAWYHAPCKSRRYMIVVRSILCSKQHAHTTGDTIVPKLAPILLEHTLITVSGIIVRLVSVKPMGFQGGVNTNTNPRY